MRFVKGILFFIFVSCQSNGDACIFLGKRSGVLLRRFSPTEVHEFLKSWIADRMV
jgi:hypothetical protein